MLGVGKVNCYNPLGKSTNTGQYSTYCTALFYTRHIFNKAVFIAALFIIAKHWKQYPSNSSMST